MTSTLKKRIEWIDIAKGVSIILVVYLHGVLSSIPISRLWLNTCLMPFFFFASGLLFSGAKFNTITPFLKKRVKTLYKPYFIFSAILLLGIWLLNDSRFSTPKHLLQYVMTGWEGWALWFVPVLSFTEILFYYINKTSGGGGKLLLFLSLAVIGRFAYLYNFPNPYNLWHVLTAVLFYGLGFILKSETIIFSRQSVIRIIGSSCLFFALSFICIMSPYVPEPAVNNMGSIWIYPAALFVTLFICTFSMILERMTNKVIKLIKSFVIYMGRNSFIVLAFHQIILKLLGKTGIFPNGVLQRLTMWIILVLLIYLIVNYCPTIIGQAKPMKSKS